MPNILALLLLGILAVPVVVLSAAIAWAFRRKRRGWAAVPGVLLLGYCGWLIDQFVPGFDRYDDLRFTRDVTGVAFTLGPVLEAHETPRSIHGDGYSVHVYRLPDHVIGHFKGPDLRRHRVTSRYREEWASNGWTSGADTARDGRYLEFALQPAPDGLEQRIRAVLARPGTRYAFLHYSSGSGDGLHVMNVDLFVVDPEARRFYLINHNT